MVANKLTINTVKSNAHVISHVSNKPKNKRDNELQRSFNRDTNKSQYLGLIIDNKPALENHNKYDEQKIACAIDIIEKFKHYFQKKTLLHDYVRVYSHLTHVFPAWGFIYKCNLQRPTILLNRAVRLLSSAKILIVLNLYIRNWTF